MKYLFWSATHNWIGGNAVSGVWNKSGTTADRIVHIIYIVNRVTYFSVAAILVAYRLDKPEKKSLYSS